MEGKQLELKHVQRELEIRKKVLDHLSAELTAQKTRKAWLEKEADESYRRASALKEALTRLRDSLSVVNALPGDNGVEMPAALGSMKQRKHYPPSMVLEEIEELIPAVAGNADALKSQATLLHDYCTVLEQRQNEMKRIVDYAYTRTQAAGTITASNVLDMTPPN